MEDGAERGAGATAVSGLGRARLRLAGWVRRAATASALSPFVLGLLEVAFHPISNAAWLDVWKTVLLAGTAGGIALAIASAVIYAGSAATGVAGTLTHEGRRIRAVSDRGDVVSEGEEARAGVVVPKPNGGARVEIGLVGGDALHAEFPSVEDGDHWLEGLGLDPANRAVSMPTHGGGVRTLRALASSALAVFGCVMTLGLWIEQVGKPPSWFVLPWLAATVATAFFAARLSRPADVKIGFDGVFLDRFLRKRRVPFSTITAVRAEERDLVLETDAGTPVRVRTESSETAGALAHRIESARRRTDASTTSIAELLARGSRTVTAWKDDLAAWLRGGSAFRDATPAPDELAQVLADPEASDVARVGAALALRASGPEQVDRVRVAAESTASPRLRVALERVASDATTDDELEEAVRELESDSDATS